MPALGYMAAWERLGHVPPYPTMRKCYYPAYAPAELGDSRLRAGTPGGVGALVLQEIPLTPDIAGQWMKLRVAAGAGNCYVLPSALVVPGLYVCCKVRAVIAGLMAYGGPSYANGMRVLKLSPQESSSWVWISAGGSYEQVYLCRGWTGYADLWCVLAYIGLGPTGWMYQVVFTGPAITASPDGSYTPRPGFVGTCEISGGEASGWDQPA